MRLSVTATLAIARAKDKLRSLSRNYFPSRAQWQRVHVGRAVIRFQYITWDMKCGDACLLVVFVWMMMLIKT